MSTFTKKDLRTTLTLLLKALGAAGAPGGEVAADAVNAAAKQMDKSEARQALQEALEKAAEAFRADARGRGWGDLADALLQLPIHDLPAFEAALRDALAAGDPAALHTELTRQLSAIYGREDAEAVAEAARLYAARVLDAVWSVPAFRDATRDILFRQQHEALQRLIALVERLPRWWRLTPAAQPRPKSALVVGERRDIPLTALKAPVRLVPFVGREGEQGDLKTWAKGLVSAPARAGLRVVIGPGGMGKTRLAVETAADLSAEGWEAFFLPPDSLRGGTDLAHLNPAAEAWFTPPRPTLYILDYAEQIAPERLRALLATLHATAARRDHPVALLFLMRPAPETNWVDEVAAVSGADVAFAEFLSRAIAPALQNPLTLQELAPAALPRLFAAARRAFVELRGQAPEREIAYEDADLPARPLAVVLLGLLAAYGHKVARSESEQAVLEDLWERWEKDKWRRTLRDRGLPKAWEPDALRMIETALVVATLGRRFHSPQELAAFWEAHDPPRHPKPNGETLAPRWLAAQMPLLFPAVEGGLAPAIVPDPLADFVLARRQDLPALVRAALGLPETGAGEFSPSQAVTALDRLYAFLAARGESTAQVEAAAQAAAEGIERWAQKAPEAARKPWVLAWHNALPAPNLTLIWRTARVVADTLRVNLAEDEAERAEALNNLRLYPKNRKGVEKEGVTC
ncbi:MAG TPA: ATP-binding protein [Chloroflexi bacterium]|nr:ATP-binding protein [Chloroflexota bacterium]